MKANPEFENLDLEFWANIKLLNQRLGYTKRTTKMNPEGGFVVPSVEQIQDIFVTEGLSTEKLITDNELTDFGKQIVSYMAYRGDILSNEVEPNLMNKDQAKNLFYSMLEELNPTCPLPMNKQKNEKRDHAFLTGLVNMLVEQNKGHFDCDYDPSELTALTENGFPIRTLSRRVDGAFPSVINPKAIWEIKEYYYTTTFGSRVADGVYETQLDGWELWEAKKNINREIEHYLIVDGHYTWWELGRSYLCRLIDSIHMGLVTEVIFGREVIDRIPTIIKQLTKYS
jgi:hypothetical protein